MPEAGECIELILLCCRPTDMDGSTFRSRLTIRVIFTWVRFNPKICYLAQIKSESSCPHNIMERGADRQTQSNTAEFRKYQKHAIPQAVCG
jgi:hypothetical protein